jgi:hypothetical protein
MASHRMTKERLPVVFPALWRTNQASQKVNAIIKLFDIIAVMSSEIPAILIHDRAIRLKTRNPGRTLIKRSLLPNRESSGFVVEVRRKNGTREMSVTIPVKNGNHARAVIAPPATDKMTMEVVLPFMLLFLRKPFKQI